MGNWKQLKKTILTNRRIQLAAAVGVCFGILLFWPYQGETPTRPVTEVTYDSTQLLLAESSPVRLRIPSIGVDAAFESPLGLKESGEIEVPGGYETVAYYGYGPTPGELGPAVILGHVDSYQGPAVLFSLGQIEEGEEILIEREEGITAIFEVVKIERHLQSGFPTKEVYEDIDHAGLRIITCSGVYDRNILRYTHNLIVYAKLVGTTTVQTRE